MADKPKITPATQGGANPGEQSNQNAGADPAGNAELTGAAAAPGGVDLGEKPEDGDEQPVTFDPDAFKKYFDSLTPAQQAQARKDFGIIQEVTNAKAAEVQPLSPTDETALLRKYGKGFVRVQRETAPKSGQYQQTVFTAQAWKQLPTGKDGTKSGWRVQVQTPPEVTKLKNAKK